MIESLPSLSLPKIQCLPKLHMDQEIRRLCSGALAQILQDQQDGDSILNTLLINTLGNLILKRRTNKSTQTDFNVQRITTSTTNSLLESNHLLPLYKLQHPRKKCIR